jgi:hypothetical protein
VKTLRPCLRCGRENAATDEACTSCSAELIAWSSEADGRPVRAARLSAGTRRVLLGGVVVIVLAVAAWLMVRDEGRGRADQGPSWRRPPSVAAWAQERFAARGATADRALALVESRTSRPRRLLMSSHAPGLEAPRLLRAAAEVLLAARDGGERLLIHAALVEHGPDDDRRSVLLPVSTAALVLTDDQALEDLLASARPGTLDFRGGETTPAGGEAVVELGPEEVAAEPPDEDDGEPEASAEPVEPPSATSASGESGDELSVTPARDRAAPARPSLGSGLKAADDEEPVRVAGRKPMPVSVLRGAGRRLAHSYEAGEQQVVLARVIVHPRTKRPLILRSLTVEPLGKLNDVEGIDFVYLVHDRDGNGRRDKTDQQVGDVVSFVDDNAPATFEDLEFAFGAEGEPAKLLLMVDFMDQNEGGTIMLTIPERDGMLVEEVATGARLRVDGLPFKGTMTTLNGDLEPDPFQEELDRLAAEGE